MKSGLSPIYINRLLKHRYVHLPIVYGYIRATISWLSKDKDSMTHRAQSVYYNDLHREKNASSCFRAPDIDALEVPRDEKKKKIGLKTEEPD